VIHTVTRHHKFLKLKRRLSVPHYVVVGVLESIWHIGCVSCLDGAIGKLSNEDIAAAIEWPGDADLLIRHLVECGWLDEHPEHRLLIHHWDQHCPNFVKGNLRKHRKTFANNQAAIAPCLSTVLKQPAQSKTPSSIQDIDDQLTEKVLPKQPAKATCPEQPAQSILPPNLTKPNLTKPNQTTMSRVTSGNPECPVPPVLTFPCAGKPSEYHLTDAQIDEWISLYAGVNVLAECKKALGWIRAQSKRKTARGMPKFLTSWLGRACDRPSFGGSQRSDSLTVLAEKRDIIGRVGQIPEDDPILASMRKSIRPNPAAINANGPNLIPNGRSGVQLGIQSSFVELPLKTKIDGKEQEDGK